MPRQARKRSRTGVYHVIFRGINKQRIFEEDQDYQKFLYALQDQKEKSGYEVYAYCLMSNHIHLLLREGREALGTSFRRIASKYVQWYNQKYDRVGHLFQDRFKSEVVEDNRYFLGVLRYIHQNPVKAGMVKTLEAYPWSSYQEYFQRPRFRLCTEDPAIRSITMPSKRVFSLTEEGKDEKDNADDSPNLITEEQRKKAKTFFQEFHKVSDLQLYLEYDRNFRWTDQDAAKFLQKEVGGKSPTELQQYDIQRRKEIVRRCREYGISLRQLERLTGISYSVLRRI